MDVTLQDKYFYICNTWEAGIYYDTATIDISGLPAWITGSLDLPNTVLNLEFDATGVTADTYTYDLGDFSIIVTVLAACSESLPACCTDSVNVSWLNRQGGWQNMQFDKVHGYDIRSGGAQIFTNDLTTKYSSVGIVHEGERLKIDVLDRDTYDYLISLKYAVQAFVDGVPILIDLESFPRYDHNTRIYEIGFSFIWAKQLSIQGQ